MLPNKPVGVDACSVAPPEGVGTGVPLTIALVSRLEDGGVGVALPEPLGVGVVPIPPKFGFGVGIEDPRLLEEVGRVGVMLLDGVSVGLGLTVATEGVGVGVGVGMKTKPLPLVAPPGVGVGVGSGEGEGPVVKLPSLPVDSGEALEIAR